MASQTEVSFIQSSVQLISCVQLFATPWAAARQSRYSKLHPKIVHKPSQVIHSFVYTASVP